MRDDDGEGPFLACSACSKAVSSSPSSHMFWAGLLWGRWCRVPMSPEKENHTKRKMKEQVRERRGQVGIAQTIPQLPSKWCVVWQEEWRSQTEPREESWSCLEPLPSHASLSHPPPSLLQKARKGREGKEMQAWWGQWWQEGREASVTGMGRGTERGRRQVCCQCGASLKCMAHTRACQEEQWVQRIHVIHTNTNNRNHQWAEGIKWHGVSCACMYEP